MTPSRADRRPRGRLAGWVEQLPKPAALALEVACLLYE